MFGEATRRSHRMILTLTRAPMTPREVRRRYSKGRVLDVVFRKGYKKRGICAKQEYQDKLDEGVCVGRLAVQKELSSVRVGSDALKERKCVADTIGDVGSEVGR